MKIQAASTISLILITAIASGALAQPANVFAPTGSTPTEEIRAEKTPVADTTAQTQQPSPQQRSQPQVQAPVVSCPKPEKKDVLEIPLPKKLATKAIEGNSDGTITVFRPTVYRAGAWRKISGYSAGQGVCSLLSSSSKKLLYVSGRTYVPEREYTQVSINSEGEVTDMEEVRRGGEVVDWIICRKKSQAEYDAEAEQARRDKEYQKRAEQESKARAQLEAKEYKKCLAERKQDPDIRCVPPRTGWAPWF